MSRRLSDERGLTVVELMVALTLSIIVLTSTLSVMDVALKNSDDVTKRASSIQRGRHAVDELVRILRSQVCPEATTTVTPVTVATPNSVTFYADFGEATGVPERHTLTLDTSTGVLTDTMYAGTLVGGVPTWPASPTRTRRITNGLAQAGATPTFQYFGFDQALNPPKPTQSLGATVAGADLARIGRIVITVRANPEGRVVGKKLSTTVQDEVFVRLADPNDSAPIPKCV